MVGLELLAALCAGRVGLKPGMTAFTVSGARFTDASGVRASAVPNLYLVGYRYPTLESWFQRWRREAPCVAQHIARDAAAAERLRSATGVREADAAPVRPGRPPP